MGGGGGVEVGGGVNSVNMCCSYDSYSVGARERSGSVVECLTREGEAPGSSLTGVTALWSLSKTH